MRVTAAALAFLVVACASVAPRTSVTGVSDRLFCGLENDGVLIPEAEITAFIEQVVEPRFPEGFTVWRAEGRWRGGTGDDGEEPTLIIEMVHPYGRAFDDKVREVADEYRRRFNQRSVMRVTSPVVMEFRGE